MTPDAPERLRSALDRHGAVEATFKLLPRFGRVRPTTVRLKVERLTTSPSGVIEAHGWDGLRLRSVRADTLHAIHRTHKVGKGGSQPPPARRRVR